MVKTDGGTKHQSLSTSRAAALVWLPGEIKLEELVF